MTDVSIELDTLYSADPELRCDVYAPAEGDARGVAILLHGGGWRVGSRTAMTDAGRAFAARGWIGVAAQYRLLGEAPWPAQIEDVKRAIRWVRASRDRFGDASDHVAVIGYSAGGHLALLAAATGGTTTFPLPGGGDNAGERPDAVVSFFAPVRVEGIDVEHLGAGEDGAREASPIRHASANFPPTLLLNGTDDSMIHHGHALDMFEALDEHGVPVDLRLYAGMTHDFQRLPEVHEMIADDVVNFLDRHLHLGAAFQEALAERRAFWEGRAAERVATQRA